jgi:hypothetical protein
MKRFCGHQRNSVLLSLWIFFLSSLLLRNPRAILKMLDYHHLGGVGG